MSLLRRDSKQPHTDTFTTECLFAMLISWVLIGVLVAQIWNLQAEASYSNRRRIYWQGLAEAR